MGQMAAIMTASSWLILVVSGMFAEAYNYLEVYGFFYGIGNGLYLYADQALTLTYIPDRQNPSHYSGLNNVSVFLGGALFAIVNTGLLLLFGKFLPPWMPGPRAGPVSENGYRYEGFAMLFFRIKSEGEKDASEETSVAEETETLSQRPSV